MTDKPGLFGIINSNRDFTQKDSWGKNQFTSSFPASLSAYLSHKNLENNYIELGTDLKTKHSYLSTTKLFGIDPKDKNTFYAFESIHNPFQQFVIGTLPRIDLVIQDKSTGNCLSGIEIKLTALPDNSTYDLPENKYSSEIVIRPDTIVYLACSIAENFKTDKSVLKSYFPNKFNKIKDWSEIDNVLPFIKEMVTILDKVSKYLINDQKPIVMQPVWKTNGKSPRLTENCLDVFVWSDLAFMKLFLDSGRAKKTTKITRQVRSIVWVFKMLLEFSQKGQFNHHKIINDLTYNTKNDKAFSLTGIVTHPYLKSKNLTKPRIKKEDLKNIIIGGGQNLLSPERRFDAIIYNSPELF